MARDPAISATGISKKFRLYHERPTTLKQAVLHRQKARYDELWALRDVSLQVAAGTTYGLIGPNGSGKSTLLRVLGRIHEPTTGTVATRGRIGALLELGAGFHPELTGRENVFLNGAIMGFSRRQVRSAFDDIVDFSGLEDFIDSPVRVYSSGMYVRLGFSVAVNLDPEILLVDEILAVGDEEFQRRCMDHIYKLRRKGTTIVLVSHALDIVRTLCDRSAWLDHGRFVAEGPSGEVVDRYLSRVNQAERERIDRGPGAVPAAAPGHATVEIVAVEVLGPRGTPEETVTTGAPVTVRIRYRVARPVDASFRLDLHHENGTHVASATSEPSDATVGASGVSHIDYRLDRLPLAPGSYRVSATAQDRALTHRFHAVENAALIRVQPPAGRTPRGLVDLGGRWSHTSVKDPAARP